MGSDDDDDDDDEDDDDDDDDDDDARISRFSWFHNWRQPRGTRGQKMVLRIKFTFESFLHLHAINS